jgi:hypothetical protein
MISICINLEDGAFNNITNTIKRLGLSRQGRYIMANMAHLLRRNMMRSFCVKTLLHSPVHLAVRDGNSGHCLSYCMFDTFCLCEFGSAFTQDTLQAIVL